MLSHFAYFEAGTLSYVLTISLLTGEVIGDKGALSVLGFRPLPWQFL
jgi:hypothetical protein